MSKDLIEQQKELMGDYQYGFHDDIEYVVKTEKGLNKRVVEAISHHKNEPDWMRQFRLKSLEIFESKPMPRWGGPSLKELDFNNVHYYLKPSNKSERSWDDVPADIKNTFDRLGIPQAERAALAGVGAQYDSESVYHNLKGEWEKQGVLFLDMDTGLREHPDLVKEYFGTVIPPMDNKFSALNSAVWSGGSFVYVPAGVDVQIPLQAYFRINSKNAGQFERTLIIVEEGANVHYVEGCTAPTFSEHALHSAVVEIVVRKGGRCRYSTIQNWSHNVFNLVTKRAQAFRDATMEWVDGNLGSKLTMKYPAVWLMEPGAKGEVMSVAFAKDGQHQDTGAKMVHCAPHTSSRITSKSISKGAGRASYRGLVKVYEGCDHCNASVECDALLLDENSRTDTYPYMEIDAKNVTIGHEATVSKIGDEQLFYLMSRGLNEEDARMMVVSGFIEPITKELPLEYAVEMNRLIQLEMEGSVG
jgi:Fe-S cluster assembly protein SufB